MSNNRNPFLNKFFSWMAIGIIIYVLFFHKNEMPDGTQISSIQQIFSGQNTVPVAPPGAPEGTVTPAPAEAVQQPANIEPVQPKEENQFAKLLAETQQGTFEQHMNEMARKQGNSIANFLQNISGVSSEEVLEGNGPEAHCGQKVTVHYTEYLPDGSTAFSTRDKSPVTFTIGDGTVIKGLEFGVEGMKKGGIRKLRVPSRFGHDEAKFHSDKIPEKTNVSIDIELIDFTPTFKAKETGFGLKSFDDAGGMSIEDGVSCGDTVMVNYKIWDIETGALLASTLVKDPETKDPKKAKDEPSKKKFAESISQPVIFKLGGGDAPYGMELGILNSRDKTNRSMKRGGKRTMIVPAYLLKTMDNKSPSPEIVDTKLPNKTVLIELELLEKIKDKEPEVSKEEPAAPVVEAPIITDIKVSPVPAESKPAN